MATTTKNGPTLTDMTFFGRQTVKYGLVLLVVMIVGRTLLTAAVGLWRALNPPAPPPPTVGFGLLPPLRFPEQIEADRPESYTLETARGTLPTFGDRAQVFYMPPSELGLLADQNARQLAAKYDFIFEPEILSSRIYRWRKPQPLESTLQLDIQTNQLKLSTDYQSRPDLIASPNLPSAEAAERAVKSYLSSGGLLPNDMATASAEVTYLKSLGGEVVEAVSFSDADYLQVDLNRVPIDTQFRIYTPGGYKGVVRAILAGTGSTRSGGQIVQLEYNYHPVDYTETETYPLRTAQAAWQDLLAGGGYVADKGEEDEAIVRTVSLGYYDDFEEQAYLQPIYVFEGDDGFIAYASALDQGFIQVPESEL